MIQFLDRLRSYHSALARLMAYLGVEDAITQAQGLYDESVAARTKLLEHERSHGCYFDKGWRSERQDR